MGVTVGVLVAAAAVSATEVAACSSADGPQPIKIPALRMMAKLSNRTSRLTNMFLLP